MLQFTQNIISSFINYQIYHRYILNSTDKSLLNILDKSVAKESKPRSWKLISWEQNEGVRRYDLTLHFQTPTVFNLNSALETASEAQGWMQAH